MVFNVKTLIRAELEIDKAVFYYENQLNTLYNFPFFEEKYNIVRVLPLKKFPYIIHFKVNESEKTVSILAITNNHQDPNTTRLKP